MKPEDSLKGKLTKEEAEYLLSNGHSNYTKDHSYDNDILHVWKQKGWIKKSALEKAREYFKDNKDFSGVSGDMFNELHSLYEKAIEEIKNS